MCGIWGAINIEGRERAEFAARALHHRGPDDFGIYYATDPVPAALVNARLSIIDLSEAGHQPMSTPDGRYWIAYNGEVYNYQVIQTLLRELGHQFISNSDTEVILHAYQEWGEACLDYLQGMFAFAVWDTVDARLFVARDRLGIKPLYYVHSAPGESGSAHFAFGSELKALLASGVVEPRINYNAVHHYLSFYSVPSPYTMLEGVTMLPPGHCMVYKDGELTVKRYWNLPPNTPLNMSESDIIARLRELLEDSIRLRMIADVPVGAFLSGGIDSSAVVALMTRISGSQLRTFSIGFGGEGAAIDERSAARVLANYYGTQHTEVIVDGQKVRDELTDIIRAMDQPSGDGINTYLVSQATAQHQKVALSGLGGDELFAGYPQYSMFRQMDSVRRKWEQMPGVAQETVRAMSRAAPPLRRAMIWLDGDIMQRYERVRILFDENAKLALYTPGTKANMGAPEPSLEYLSQFLHPANSDSLDQLTRLELQNYMAHTLLRDTDAMSMAHSLEVRVPLIDHKLVEFAVRIPSDMKLRGGRTKWILVEALRDVLPAEVLERPKRGFEMPVAAWMRNELHDVLDDVFSQESVNRRGMFDYTAASSVYLKFQAGQAPSYIHAWSLAVLELWMRAFIDNAPRVN